MSRVVSPPKQLHEQKSYFFDCLSLLQNGETIVSAFPTMTLYSGADINPGLMITGLSTSFSGSVINLPVKGGATGNIYLLTILIVTNISNILEMSTLITIIPEGL